MFIIIYGVLTIFRVATKWVSDIEFRELIWPEYLKFNTPILHKPDILVLDGTSQPHTQLQMALDFISGKPVHNEIELLRQHLADDTPLSVSNDQTRRRSWTPDAGSAAGRRRSTPPQISNRKRKREYDDYDEGTKRKQARTSQYPEKRRD